MVELSQQKISELDLLHLVGVLNAEVVLGLLLDEVLV